MLCYYIIGPIVLFIKMLKLFFNIKYTQYLQVLVATSTFVADVEDVTSACVVCVPLTWYNTSPRMESLKKVSLLYEESEKINNQRIAEYQ